MDSDNAMEEGEVCSSNEHSNDEATGSHCQQDQVPTTTTNPAALDSSYQDDRLVIDLPSTSSDKKTSVDDDGNLASPKTASSPNHGLVNGDSKSDETPSSSSPAPAAVEVKAETSAVDDEPPPKAGSSSYTNAANESVSDSSPSKCTTTTNNSRKRAASSSNDEQTHHHLHHQQSATATNGNNSSSGGSKNVPAKRKKKQNGGRPGDGAAAKIARTQNSRRDASTWVRSIATEVDSDSLGPCEPGTHVNLDGVVWNETNNGLLVVNVTWRGKSYMGTLLDCTRFDWAPPRLCESPLMELTPAKGRSGKRSHRNNNHHHNSNAAAASHNHLAAQTTANLQQELRRSNSNNNGAGGSGSNGGGGQMKHAKSTGKLSINIHADDDDSSQQGPSGHNPDSQLEPLSPVLRECPCRHCCKQFDGTLALKYHQNSAHPPPRRPDTPPRLQPPPPPPPTAPAPPVESMSTVIATAASTSAVPQQQQLVSPMHKRSQQQNVPHQSVSPRVLNRALKQSPPAAAAAAVKTEVKSDGEKTLSPEENASLQQLFGVVTNGSGGAQDFPKLEATTPSGKQESSSSTGGGGGGTPNAAAGNGGGSVSDRANSRSPTAYSDISDDAAPVLEKEVPTTNDTTPMTPKAPPPPPAAAAAAAAAAVGASASATASATSVAVSAVPKPTATAPAPTPPAAAGSSKMPTPSSSSKSVAVVQPQCSHQPSPPDAASSKHQQQQQHMVAAAMAMPRASLPSMSYAGGFIPPAAFMASPYSLQPMVMLPAQQMQQQSPHAVVTSSAAAAGLHKIHELAKASTQSGGSSSLSPQASTSTSMAGGLKQPAVTGSGGRTDTPPVQRHHHIHQHNMMGYFPAAAHFSPADQYALSMLSQHQSAAALQNAGLPPK